MTRFARMPGFAILAPRAALLTALLAGCSPDEPSESPEPSAPGTSAAPVQPAAQGGSVELEVPAGEGSGQAHLAAGPDGAIVLSWLEPAPDGSALKLATLEGGAFGDPTTVASGGDLMVSWADFPAVVPISSDFWVAHWLRAAPQSVAAYDIVVALSTDGGATFGEGELLNLDGTLSEHGFASWFRWDGDAGIVWLDGRRIAEQFESGDFDPDGPPVGTSLRFARIRPDGTVAARGEIDALACDCCRTSATAAGGEPLVAYRDRTPDEIRDIAVRRFDDGEWTAPVILGPDGWRIEGCPVNGPAVAADEDRVAVAWFTAAEPAPRVRLAQSSDGGATFGAPIEIDSDNPYGQTDVALLAGGDTVVSWWRKAADGGTELAVRRVSGNGHIGDIVRVARSDVAQPVDVPQMTAAGAGVVLAWTDAGTARVRSAEVRWP